MGKEAIHWADNVVKRIIAQKGDQKEYVCAAGITPSGTVHIGNFREIMTVELVVRALKDAGKKVRFIYSWDDFDVFRKIPQNMPKQEMLKKYLRQPIVDVPDPFGEEESYARHHEVAVEKDVAVLGIYPEFIYQAKQYRAGTYVEGIKVALQKAKEIREILNKYRKEPLDEAWLPIRGYCPECNKDEVSFSNYDGEYGFTLHCSSCKKDVAVDLRKTKHIKLPWRVDWPMRWDYEKVTFEPGGKDHSTPGSSFTTGKEIVKLYDWTAPSYQFYDFIRIKGQGGKISSSKGNVITLRDCLEIYEPEIIRYIFAGTRPNTEFAMSFDIDVIKVYEDFDKVERTYFGEEEIGENKKNKVRRIYELSIVEKIPKKRPIQVPFRHLTTLIQINEGDVNKVLALYKKEIKNKSDEKKLKTRTECAKNWLEKYAPEEFKFSVQKEVPKNLKLSKEMVNALKDFAEELEKKDWTDKELHEYFYNHMREREIEPKDAFKACYNVLINKDKGPQLASFILTIGKERVASLFKKL